MHYLGPGNYFYEEKGKNIDILNQTLVENLDGTSYNLGDESIELRSKPSNPDPNETTTDTKGYTVVNRADYFRKLKKFPENWFGECGIVALSIMLGYYDTFYNDNFIPNDKTYDARYYKRKTTRSAESDWEFDYSKNQELTSKAATKYKNTTNYNFRDWTRMPGTTYAMRDYLFDNYMHTFAGLGWDDVGYPMLDGELKSTMKDYINANCSSLMSDIEMRSGNLFYTHAKPVEYINEGLPTCLVLQKYDSAVGSGKAHVVVAYGHKDGKFLTHFGWAPNSSANTEVVLNSATIYGYFTLKYKGEHVHSRNVTMSSSGTTYGICGCGEVIKI